MRPPSQVRYLAPAALVVCAVVVVVVVVAGSSAGTHRSTPSSVTGTGSHRGHRLHRFYHVRPGDTLSRVALKTGIPLNRLEALNPRLDPSSLHPRERIRLRP